MIRQKRMGDAETQTRPDGFGLDVQVRRPLTNPEHNPSGNPTNDGETARGELDAPPFRNVIPEGAIGSTEGLDKVLPPPQYVDTVPMYVGETNDPKLHGPVAALRSADRTPIAFNDYAVFVPRRAAMPRAAQDDLYLQGYGSNVADPRMTPTDASDAPNQPENKGADRVDLFGRGQNNRDGVVNR